MIWRKALLSPFITTGCKVNNSLPNLTTELKPNIAIKTHMYKHCIFKLFPRAESDWSNINPQAVWADIHAVQDILGTVISYLTPMIFHMTYLSQSLISCKMSHTTVFE